MKDSKLRLKKRHLKIRSKIKGSKTRPRLVVFRSNSHIYGMLVDDKSGKTLISVADKNVSKKDLTKTEKAMEVGKLLAEKAVKEKINQAIFDRAGYLYHGRVKALAEGAREGGLKF
jgi:large subunit ribosomal protein L18